MVSHSHHFFHGWLSNAHVFFVAATGVFAEVDRCDVPRSLTILLTLVSVYVAKLDQHLGESLLLFRWSLWVENRWGRAIFSKCLLETELRLNVEPVSMLVL